METTKTFQTILETHCLTGKSVSNLSKTKATYLTILSRSKRKIWQMQTQYILGLQLMQSANQ